jgi:hypothetical protein
VKKGEKRGDGLKNVPHVSEQEKENEDGEDVAAQAQQVTSHQVTQRRGREEPPIVDLAQDIDISFLNADNGNDLDIELPPLVTSSPRSTFTSNTQPRPYNKINSSNK